MTKRTKLIAGLNGSQVLNLTEAEETQRDVQEQAWADGAGVRAMEVIRTKRDGFLAATDWRFRSDQTPSQAWIDYCQALRDLPANTPDPVNPTWPTEPGE